MQDRTTEISQNRTIRSNGHLLVCRHKDRHVCGQVRKHGEGPHRAGSQIYRKPEFLDTWELGTEMHSRKLTVAMGARGGCGHQGGS